jgi:hypothetical protein
VSEILGSDPIFTRMRARDQLWLLQGMDGTYLCARHAQAGLVLLSWTTREEMEVSVGRLMDRAPGLFEQHQPVQRSFREAVGIARRCGCRLRIDEYVLEGFRRLLPGERETADEPT